MLGHLHLTASDYVCTLALAVQQLLASSLAPLSGSPSARWTGTVAPETRVNQLQQQLAAGAGWAAELASVQAVEAFSLVLQDVAAGVLPDAAAAAVQGLMESVLASSLATTTAASVAAALASEGAGREGLGAAPKGSIGASILADIIAGRNNDGGFVIVKHDDSGGRGRVSDWA